MPKISDIRNAKWLNLSTTAGSNWASPSDPEPAWIDYAAIFLLTANGPA